MTYDSRFCEGLFGTLGRDDTLRHAYRVYLWRRALGLVYHPPLDAGVIAGADLSPDFNRQVERLGCGGHSTVEVAPGDLYRTR